MNIIEKITESIFFKDLIAKINSLIDNSNEVGGKVEFLEEIDTSKFEYLDDIENKASKTELSSAISTHNTHDAAHNDIRLLIQGLSTRLNALADSDDTTLDQMSEIVAYIKANKSLIESITTDKISVSDIIDNLETNLTTKPLSAAQGVVLKSLIDTLNGVINELTPSAIGALSKNQGAANVGKVLVVGTDGNVIPMMLPTEDSDEDVVGVLDESNNIILMGELADGTYILKYENEDGTYTEIGNLVVGSIEPELTCTNLLPISTDVNGNQYIGTNGELGYKDGYKISITSGEESAETGIKCTGFIPVTYGATIYFRGISLHSTGSKTNYVFYNANKVALGGANWYRVFPDGVNGEVVSVKIDENIYLNNSADISSVAYIRISASYIDENSIVTVNEAIE